VYVLQDPPCENWTAAVAKAKQKAGCGSNGTRATCPKCKLPCNICQFLEDGNLPEAFINETVAGTTANGGVGTVPSVSGRVALFPRRLCKGTKNIDTLARSLFHEALHFCKEAGATGSRTEDGSLRPFSGTPFKPDAEDTTNECFK
jgi:hypothetical protein